MQNLIDRKRRSEKLTKEEHKSLALYVKTFPTLFDAALVIGISRQVLDRVLLIGSGSSETVKAIREKIAA